MRANRFCCLNYILEIFNEGASNVNKTSSCTRNIHLFIKIIINYDYTDSNVSIHINFIINKKELIIFLAICTFFLINNIH